MHGKDIIIIYNAIDSYVVFDTKKIDEYSERAKDLWGKTPEYKEFEKKRQIGHSCKFIEHML